MQFFLVLKLAVKNFYKNTTRTFFSLAGIMIGVAAVIVVLSLGGALRFFIDSQISAFGTDIIQVEYKVPKVNKTSSENMTGAMGGQAVTLKLKDAEVIGKSKFFKGWYAGSIGQGVISYLNKDKNFFLMGVTSGIQDVDMNFKIASGRMFSDEEENSIRQVVVLGSKAKEYFFKQQDPLGKSLKINGRSYKVIGVAEERGGATGFFDFDNIIYLPLQTIQKKIMGIEHLGFAIFKLRDPVKTSKAILETERIMRVQHKINDSKDDDFAVNSVLEAREMMDKIFLVVDALLIGLTSISLIVGGVGIMNVMYVSVVERTFEIGLRKALGATNRDILKQFLLEAFLLTVCGGICGVILGLIIILSSELIIQRLNFFITIPLSFKAVILGMSFSSLVGLIFGLYPAIKASKLEPIEAFRRE